MRKSINKYMAWLVLGMMLNSCNTDVESLSLDQPDVEGRYPEAYAAYLQNLRSYRASDHKQVYAWFDNSVTQTYSRCQHITDLPDSIDVIVLEHPANVTDQMQTEMAKVRSDKGMKVIYDVDFDALKEESSLKDATERLLGYCDTYGFDGIMVCFNGMATNHLDADELAIYKEQEATFFGLVGTWIGSHSDKLVAFNGKPQNVSDKSLFDKCRILFVSQGAEATNRDQWTYYLALASVDGVPAEKLGMTVSCTSLSDDDTKTGWFGDGTRAIASMGQWAYYSDVKGAGIKNIASDYFNNTYSYSRAMIQTMVPAGR